MSLEPVRLLASPATAPASNVRAEAFTGSVKGSRVLMLRLRGSIGPDAEISLANVRRQFGHIDNTVCGLRFEITSTGGKAAEAQKIYTLLRSFPFPVSGKVVSYCSSAAVEVLLAASHRAATKDATILIHATRNFVKDFEQDDCFTASSHLLMAKQLAKSDREMADLYHARTGYDRAWFRKQFKHEQPLSDNEALTSGIVHEIEGVTPPCHEDWAMQMRAERNYQHPPNYLTASYLEACRTADYLSCCQRYEGWVKGFSGEVESKTGG